MLTPRSAPLRLELHKAARDEQLPSHISKLTKVANDDDAKHAVDFGQGVVMKLERFPYLPKKQDPLAEYSIPVSVRLLLKVIAEGSIVFLLMFLLSVGSLTNNHHRADYRMQCRRAASTAKGYAVLTNFSAASAADRAEIESLLNFDPRSCGYDGLPIRRFDSATVDRLYQHSNQATLLTTALGACQEYRECDTAVDPLCNEYLLPRGPTEPNAAGVSGNPLLISTPGAIYCVGFQASSTASQVTQLLAYLLFLAFLVRIRWLSQYYARYDDSSRITTADYSLSISGLNKSIAPDDLKVQLKEQLEALTVDGVSGCFAGKIHHVEVGRACRREVSVMNKMKALVQKAEELEARKKYKEDKGKPFDAEVGKLKGLVADYTDLCAQMQQLIVEPDTSTGHAFVVFHEEMDRNKCYAHFNKQSGKKADKKSATYESAVDAVPETLACANNTERTKSIARQVFEAICSLQERREHLTVQAAPEPDQINWDALELDDWHEQKVVVWGRLLNIVIVAVGATCLLVLKFWQAVWRPNVEPGTSKVNVLIAEASGKSGIAAAVSLVTLVFNVVIKSTAKTLVKWEGQDTRTEEQTSVFNKLSIALTINTAIVPLFVGMFLSNGTLADQTWYEPSGLVTSAALLIVFNYATDFSQVVRAGPLFARAVLSRFAYSKTTLLEYWKPVPFAMGYQYARCLVMMTLGLVYGPLYPIAYLLTAFGLVLKWLCTRFAMRHWYAHPANIDQEIMMSFRWRLGNLFGVGVIVQCIALSQATGLTSGGDISTSTADRKALEAAGLVLFGAPILTLIYTLFPLGVFKSLARFDQLGDVNDTDTGGLRFDDAAKREGYPMPHYVCPTLPILKDAEIANKVAGEKLSSSAARSSVQAKQATDVVQAAANARRAAVLLAPYGLDEKAMSISTLLGGDEDKEYSAIKQYALTDIDDGHPSAADSRV